jgi:hypothetical protein
VNLTSPTLEDRQRGGNISGRFIEKAFSCFFDIAFVKPCGASNDTAAPGTERFAAKA